VNDETRQCKCCQWWTTVSIFAARTQRSGGGARPNEVRVAVISISAPPLWPPTPPQPHPARMTHRRAIFDPRDGARFVEKR